MKGFFEFIALFSLRRVYTLICSLVKGYLVTVYIEIVDVLRSIYFLLIAIIATVVLLFAGISLLHVALFLYLPWQLSEKIILLFVLGLVYVSISMAALAFLQSKKRWLSASGAKKFFDDTNKNKL